MSAQEPAPGPFLPALVGLLAYATVIARGTKAIEDPDVYLHIAVGRWILAHGRVPDRDVFSGSVPGASWVPHEWLAQVATAWTYDHLGWGGLIIAAGLLLGATLALLSRALLRHLRPAYVLIGCGLAWGLCFPHLLTRPHLFSFPILVIWVAALVSAREHDRAPPPLLALLMVPWANLHGDFMVGLVVAAALAGEAMLEASGRARLLRAARSWGLFIALSVLAALATPNGAAGLTLPFELLRMDFALSWVNEWQSPNFQMLQPVESWIMLVLLAALYRGLRLPVVRIGMVLGLLHAALQHQRQSELLGLIAPLLAAPALGAQLPHVRGEAAFDRLGRRAGPRGTVALKAAAVGCLGLLALALTLGAVPVRTRADRYTPAAALAAIKDANLSGSVLNAYVFGDYLIFSGFQPFIDGRIDLYGDDFVRRYADIAQLPALLAQYRIGWTLLEPRNSRLAVLDQLPGWRRLYSDDVAVVHVRTP